MAANPHGPYSRLRWFCDDGTVFPPQPYACAEHGGGKQHGEYSPEREELASLGLHVGTIFAAMTWDEAWAGRRQERLRELPLEKYLTDVEDGWVLRGARNYRGRIQVEDEEAAGQALLEKLLGQRDWVAGNFLAAREAVRAIPHGGASEDRTREIRRIAKDIADQDRTFEPLRVKIHNEPGPEDIATVNAWLVAARARPDASALVSTGESLVAAMEKIYGEGGRTSRLAAAVSRYAKDVELSALLQRPAGENAAARTLRLMRLLRALRERIESASGGRAAVAFADTSVDVETDAVMAAADAARSTIATRSDLMRLAVALTDGAYGEGYLSARERDALEQPALSLANASDADARAYLTTARSLEGAAGWALGTIRHAFAEPLTLYGAVDPKAERFPDDLLRSSVMLVLGDVAGRLARDAERQSGVHHSIFGRELTGIAGLNSGIAVGKLHVISDADAAAGVKVAKDEIVVLQSTTSELDPVAGILTASAGNALSHVQMLARNLGIPNATVPPLALADISRHAGEQVVHAVGTGGSVILVTLDSLDPALRDELTGEKAKAAAAVKLDAPVPDLSVVRPLRLAELDASLSGKVVGPKAANVGELARHFPDRVAPAVAVPFGIYAMHAASGPGSPKSRLDAAFVRYRAGEIDDAALAQAVETMRQEVEKLTILPEIREQIRAAMLQELGPGSYGVFVRSDTNVEDLPQFTGAGLNATIPNVVGFDAQMAAIPKVWASPFTARAMAWRMRALKRPEEVYPSVLLMKSVPNAKSGVLATADVATGGQGITVSMAWGVGGAVDGEVAETLVLRPDGTDTLVSEAKAPYQRYLAASGGVDWLPAAAGQVLTPDERLQLRGIAADLTRELKPALGDNGVALPWDSEMGFADGRLMLLQVRPVKSKGPTLADRVINVVAPASGPAVARVPMGASPSMSASSSELLPAR
jgi:hypothetical protein